MKKIAILLAAFLMYINLNAQGYNIGDKVADFSLKNVDGKMTSMANFKDVKGYVVVFTCNHCPFAKMYEDRIIALSKAVSEKGYQLIAINPNDGATVEEDSYQNMQKRSEEKKYGFPYVWDETQNVAKAFGATRTPHTFVVQKVGSDFVLQFIGAIDDNAQDANAVKTKYVEKAIDELNAGKPVTEKSVKAIGCTIKWKA